MTTDEPMRCLTLIQPWAGLVAAGIKGVENRPRHIIRREDFGRPFALHAGRAIAADVYDRIYRAAPELRSVTTSDPGRSRWYPLSRITSAIIAVATIVDVIEVDGLYEDAIATALEKHGVDPDQQLRFTFGPIVYVLRDVIVLPEPVPHRGLQGFVRLPPRIEGGEKKYPGEVEERVRAQLPGGGR